MRRKSQSQVTWAVLATLALLGALFGTMLGGCRDRSQYQPPEYAPPPPPPPPSGQISTERTTQKLEKRDPLDSEPTLVDPKDAQVGDPDLKSVIAGFRDNDIVMRFELYEPPPKEGNFWAIVCLARRSMSNKFYIVKVWLDKPLVLGLMMDRDVKTTPEPTALSGNVKVVGNSILLRFPWERLPEEFQYRDLNVDHPIIQQVIHQEGGKGKATSRMVDEITGRDQVRL